ncbi:DUF4013 domain-containing protein [Halorussus sp. GCM10023401]|uniref:DUF4013 domain-containing protein n=1 Tax=Halorussus sp. GCM10023401 TaxID=3252680 RepID=UPI003617B6D3
MEEQVKTALLGGFLWYYGTVTVVPLIFVWGYLIGVLRRSTRAEKGYPSFSEWRVMFWDGVKAYGIWSVYLSIPIISITLEERGTVESGKIMAAFLVLLAGGGILAILVPYGGEALGIIGQKRDEIPGPIFDQIAVQWDRFLLLLLVWYVTPAALMKLSTRSNFFDGFDFTSLRTILTDRRYVLAWPFFLLSWLVGYLFLPLTANTLSNAVWSTGRRYGFLGLGNVFAEAIVTIFSIFSFCFLVASFTIIGRVWATIQTESESDAVGDEG